MTFPLKLPFHFFKFLKSLFYLHLKMIIYFALSFKRKYSNNITWWEMTLLHDYQLINNDSASFFQFQRWWKWGQQPWNKLQPNQWCTTNQICNICCHSNGHTLIIHQLHTLLQTEKLWNSLNCLFKWIRKQFHGWWI